MNQQPHTTATVELSKTLKLYEEYGIVYFQYVEHSPDHWYSDTETDVEINKEEAQKIIDFLAEKFKLSSP